MNIAILYITGVVGPIDVCSVHLGDVFHPQAVVGVSGKAVLAASSNVSLEYISILLHRRRH